MRTAALLVLLLACQGDSRSVAERASAHAMADRTTAMAALSAGLDEAYLVLKDHPGDTTIALGRARTALERYYTADEAAAFELFATPTELMLYIPTARPPTLWLARTPKHLIVEPGGLSPAAKATLGL